MMKNKTKFNSIYEIRIAKERLRYETAIQSERLSNKTGMLFSGVSFSLRNLSFRIRNRLFTYAFVRSLSRTKMLHDFLNNFIRGFRQSG